MKVFLITLYAIFCSILVQGQYNVTFILKEESGFKHDSIFIAGSFNNWDASANKVYLLRPYGQYEKAITLNLKGGIIKYKFHRGSWATVEIKANGDDVPDRMVKISGDTTLTESIALWRDWNKDNLRTLLSTVKEDTSRAILLYNMGLYYEQKSMPDSAIFWATQGLHLAQKTGNKELENNFKLALSHNYWRTGDFATAIKLAYPIFVYGESVHDTNLMFRAAPTLMNAYRDQGDYREALKYIWKNMTLIRNPDSFFYAIVYAMIGSNYYGLEKYDSANFFLKKAIGFDTQGYGWILLMAGRIVEQLNDNNAALNYYRQSIVRLVAEENLKDLAGAYNSLASLYEKISQPDSAIHFANLALILDEKYKFNKEKAETYLILSKAYEKINPRKAFDYYKLAIGTRDSLFGQEKQRQISSFKFNEELNQAEFQNKIEQSQLKYRNRFKIYILVAGILALLFVTGGLWRRNIYKQRSFALLQKQKQEIAIQKEKAETTLEELKSTQALLIQSEKMASLGELTAGIAHEIQNPLNFVNNFADVNSELIAEMKHELDNGKIDDAKAIANNIDDNEQKIIFHGKRADAIVKGMLQHSRSSNGQKVPTDINALADEYLRLAYHGLRAKDKSFNATMKTDFDESIGLINIVPQDIGRVILNLITNAFYAVSNVSPQPPKGGSDFSPTVTISTRRLKPPLGDLGANKVEISVKDNGPGIPQHVLDKVFQPFFTTKPTGQGTGLGLSLSYDIVKAHGGEIKIETKENEGTTFSIYLPIT